jgi:hypothetical protein
VVFVAARSASDHLEIGVDAILVARIDEVERSLRRGSCVVLLARFDLRIVQRVQVVLNLLESGERCH